MGYVGISTVQVRGVFVTTASTTVTRMMTPSLVVPPDLSQCRRHTRVSQWEELNRPIYPDEAVAFGDCNAHDDALAGGATRSLAVQKTHKSFTMVRNSTDPYILMKPLPLAVQAATFQVLVLATKHRAKRRLKTQCERAQPTQATIEIVSSHDFPFAFPKVRSKELTMNYLCNSMIERCQCDRSMDTRDLHDGPIVQKTTQVFY